MKTFFLDSVMAYCRPTAPVVIWPNKDHYFSRHAFNYILNIPVVINMLLLFDSWAWDTPVIKWIAHASSFPHSSHSDTHLVELARTVSLLAKRQEGTGLSPQLKQHQPQSCPQPLFPQKETNQTATFPSDTSLLCYRCWFVGGQAVMHCDTRHPHPDGEWRQGFSGLMRQNGRVCTEVQRKRPEKCFCEVAWGWWGAEGKGGGRRGRAVRRSEWR